MVIPKVNWFANACISGTMLSQYFWYNAVTLQDVKIILVASHVNCLVLAVHFRCSYVSAKCL